MLPVKALEQEISSETSFIIHDNEKRDISQNLQSSTKNRILEHVRGGTDVILVTSAKHGSEPISVERYFSDIDPTRLFSFHHLLPP